MRRRTTILDVLREDRARAGDVDRERLRSNADSAEGQERQSAEVERSRRARGDDEPRPTRGGRRGHAASHETGTPGSATADRAPPTAGTPRSRTRRVTGASGQSRGLRLANWLQRDLSVARGYVVAACAVLLLLVWGTFELGQLSGGTTSGPTDPNSVAKAPPKSTAGKPTPMSETGIPGRRVAPVVSEPTADSIAGFNLVSYSPSDASKAKIRAMIAHLTAELEGTGASAEAFARKSRSGGQIYVVAVLLPTALIGDDVGAQRFFDEVLRKLPAPDPKLVTIDFDELEVSPIPLRDLPNAKGR